MKIQNRRNNKSLSNKKVIKFIDFIWMEKFWERDNAINLNVANNIAMLCLE